jgi:hypothetical protein
MNLTQKEIKFLSILDETRLTDGKISQKYFEEIKEHFIFTKEELRRVVVKLVKMNLIEKVNAGRDENVYFHTDKVTKSELDTDLIKIKH